MRIATMSDRIPLESPEQARTWLACAALWTLLAAKPASGDDTELFVTDTRRFAESRPNVLLIVDTSASLAQEIQTRASYDLAVGYTGDCDPARVYWRTGVGAPPRCSTDRWFERTALVCQMSLDAFTLGIGRHTDHFAQFDAAVGGRWERLDEREKNRLVECEDDGGRHGDGTDPRAVFAQYGDVDRPWSQRPTRRNLLGPEAGGTPLHYLRRQLAQLVPRPARGSGNSPPRIAGCRRNPSDPYRRCQCRPDGDQFRPGRIGSSPDRGHRHGPSGTDRQRPRTDGGRLDTACRNPLRGRPVSRGPHRPLRGRTWIAKSRWPGHGTWTVAAHATRRQCDSGARKTSSCS